VRPRGSRGRTRREYIATHGKDVRQFGAQEAKPLPHRNAALQQESADLIDNAGALTDEPFTDSMQRLQVELVGRLGDDEPHRRALYCLRDRFRVAEVIFLSFGICADVFGWHQPRIVALRLQLAAQVMRTNTSLHADQTRRKGCEPRFYLAT
jgi:hypothetical protein